MYISILLFPLFSAFFCGFYSKYIGSKGSAILSVFCTLMSLVMAVHCFLIVGFYGNVVHVTLFTWIQSGLFLVTWGFLFDSLTAVILVVVTCVSTLVHYYSTAYISADPHLCRFISYLSFFTFFMLVLVTADNFIQIFLGWEGVGLCSYLLINFWFTRIQANKAAIKAILVNRVGDFGLCLGIFIIFFQFGSVNYATVFSLVPFVSGNIFTFFSFSVNIIDFICFFLFIGSVGKSAQLGLHTWLPDAMEGPTPVSALIHAATIVTAGVFLLVRCSPLFEYSPNVLWFVSVIGGITAFFAATTGLFQNDLKKVIAYSTCSQLGYMVFACGVSSYNVGIFHLTNHAFFKALLFLAAGSVIHAINDEQDMRKMGGLVRLIPFSYSMMFIGSFALLGFPFLSGFYSKDVILELAFAHYTTNGLFAFILGSFSAFFTAFYSIRLLFLTFLAKPSGFKKTFEGVHEAPFQISFCLFVLCVGSIFFGYAAKDLFVGFGSPFFSNSVFIFPNNFHLPEAEFLSLYFKLVPFFFSTCGLLLGFWFYYVFYKSVFILKYSFFGISTYTFFNRKWFFDKVYNEFVTQNYITVSFTDIYKNYDKGFFEIFGPFGFSLFFYGLALKFSRFQSGQLFHYTLVIFIGISFFLTVLFMFFYFSAIIIDVRVLFTFVFLFFT